MTIQPHEWGVDRVKTGVGGVKTGVGAPGGEADAAGGRSTVLMPGCNCGKAREGSLIAGANLPTDFELRIVDLALAQSPGNE